MSSGVDRESIGKALILQVEFLLWVIDEGYTLRPDERESVEEILKLGRTLWPKTPK